MSYDMKQKFFLFIILCYSSVVFADHFKEFEKSDAQLHTHPSSQLYPYLKIGIAPLVPNVGVGVRSRNLMTGKGNDFNIHANFLFLDKEFDIFPSIKYTALWYKNTSLTSRYFGVGFEACFFEFGKPVIIPNIELVWGTERERMRFSQFGINLCPVVFLTWAVCSGELKGNEEVVIPAVGLFIGSYTVGF